jgi:hypothetical protein
MCRIREHEAVFGGLLVAAGPSGCGSSQLNSSKTLGREESCRWEKSLFFNHSPFQDCILVLTSLQIAYPISPSNTRPFPAASLNHCSKLLNCPRISRHSMAFAMIKDGRSFLLTHCEESHGAVDVGVVAADDVTRRNVNNVLAFIGE